MTERWEADADGILIFVSASAVLSKILHALLLFSKKCRIHFSFDPSKAPGVRPWTGRVKQMCQQCSTPLSSALTFLTLYPSLKKRKRILALRSLDFGGAMQRRGGSSV